MEAVKVKDFGFDYAIGGETALHDVNFTVNEGEFIVVCGKKKSRHPPQTK